MPVSYCFQADNFFSYSQFPEYSNSLAQFQHPDLPGFNFSSHVHVDIKTQASKSLRSPMRHSTSVRAHYSTWFQSLFLVAKFSTSWFTFKCTFQLSFPNTFCAWIQKVIEWNFTSLKAALLAESLTIFPKIQFRHHLGFHTRKVIWNINLIVFWKKCSSWFYIFRFCLFVCCIPLHDLNFFY